MTHTDWDERAALIDGLRELASYLESHPNIPAPSSPVVYTFPEGGWPLMRAQVDSIAVRFGVTPHSTAGGHYVAVRSFGPIQYRAVAIPRKDDSDDGESE